jgi:hypothetical protein
MSYQVRPEDVVVVDARAGGRPPEELPRVAAWIRRYRFRLALALALFEVIVFALGSVNRFALLAVAILIILGYISFGRSLPSATLRQVAWVVAFAQGLVALFPLALGLSLFVIGIVAVVALLIMMMLLLGERSR